MTEPNYFESLIRAGHRAARADRFYTSGLTGYSDLLDRLASALQASTTTSNTQKETNMTKLTCNYCGWTIESSSFATVVAADRAHREECPGAIPDEPTA